MSSKPNLCAVPADELPDVDDCFATVDPLQTIRATSQTPDSENQATGHPSASPGDVADSLLVTLDGEQQTAAEQIRDAFLRAWDSGSIPNWTEFLPLDATAQFRDQVAYLLIVIDIQRRGERDQVLSEQQYLSQAPELEHAIKSALTKKKTVGGSTVHDPGDSHLQHWSIGDSDRVRPRYEPLNIHARGGLGAVYRAKDLELGRVVALKRILPKREADSGSKSRFVFEAEVTGSLEHPGIVPVYGLGHYGDDRPYYAMRFVSGDSLSMAIRNFHQDNPNPAKSLFFDRSFRQLLLRLMDCCNALHYAHERGVLHRDIKPDNIMLGKYGETLVVDWGLAKLVRRPGAESQDSNEDDLPPLTVNQRIEETRLGMVVGTPMYMSPEQAMGLHDQLTPASDVYSLGAILFRMIGDEHPIAGKTSRDVVINVRSGKVRDLSTVAPHAPAPLISICRKAMALNAEDRYPSAVALSQDLDRWLGADKVLAHQESFFETATRLLGRYRSVAVASLLAMALITMVSVLATFIVNQAKNREQIANRQAQQFKSEAISRYQDSRRSIDRWLVEGSDALEYFPATSSVRIRLLQLAYDDYSKIATKTSEDPALELERGRTLVRLGDIQRAMENQSVARGHYRDAMKLFSKPSIAAGSGQSGLAVPFAAEAARARSRLALAMAAAGELESADREFESAISALQTILQQGTSELASRYFGSAMVNWGNVALQAGQLDIARKRFQDGVTALQPLSENTDPSDRLLIAQAMELQGRAEVMDGGHQKAEQLFSDAIARVNEWMESDTSEDPRYRDTAASLLVSRGRCEYELGRSDAQIKTLSQAIQNYRELTRAIPDLPRYRENLALSLIDLGLVYYDLDRCRDAKPLLDESDSLVVRLIDDHGDETRFRILRATMNDAMAQTLFALGETESAMTRSAESISEYQTLIAGLPDRPDLLERLAISQSHLAGMLAAKSGVSQEMIGMSAQAFDAAIETLRELAEKFPDAPRYRRALAQVCAVRSRRMVPSDANEAQIASAEAREIWETMGAQRTARDNADLAWLLLTGATVDAQKAVEVASTPPQVLATRNVLAIAQMKIGDWQSASQTLSPYLETDPVNRSGRIWLILSLWFDHRGDDEASADALKRGKQWFANQAPQHPELDAWLGLLQQMNQN